MAKVNPITNTQDSAMENQDQTPNKMEQSNLFSQESEDEPKSLVDLYRGVIAIDIDFFVDSGFILDWTQKNDIFVREILDVARYFI